MCIKIVLSNGVQDYTKKLKDTSDIKSEKETKIKKNAHNYVKKIRKGHHIQ